MRTLRTLLVAGAGALGIAGLAGLAMAQGPAVHQMTIQLPGGGTAHIAYTGNVAPNVSFVPLATVAFPAPYASWAPFAEMDRISAMMDRQMQALIYQTRALDQLAMSSPLTEATLGALPSGSSRYVVSSMSGNGFCMRSVQITSTGNGQPQVVSHTSGNCGSQASTASPSSTAAPAISFKTVEPRTPSRQGI